MFPLRRVATALAAFLVPFGAVQVGVARHLAEAQRFDPVLISTHAVVDAPVYVIPDILHPVEHPAEVAARDARFLADRARMAQWSVDGERGRVEAEARAEAARQEAEALELQQRATKVVAARTNHEDVSPRLGGSSGGGNTSGVNINCESGGDYTNHDGIYSGAYQFDRQTWHAAGGSTDTAAEASPAEQDAVAASWVASGHRDAWPNC